MLRITLKKTRRFVNTVIKPRPTPTFPKSTCRACCSYKPNSNRVSRDYNCVCPAVNERKSVKHAGKARIEPTPGHTVSPQKPQPTHAVEPCQVEQPQEANQSPTHSCRTLKSCKTMKHRSISGAASSLEKRRRDLAETTPQSANPIRPPLRRNKRIVSCPASRVIIEADGHREHSAGKFRRRCVSDGYRELQVKDPLSSDTDDSSSDSSVYITARSAFSEPTEIEEFQTILQMLDTESGAIFEKIFQVKSKIFDDVM